MRREKQRRPETLDSPWCWRAREPDKVEDWAWYDLDALPSPLFYMVPTAIEALRGDRRMWGGR